MDTTLAQPHLPIGEKSSNHIQCAKPKPSDWLVVCTNFLEFQVPTPLLSDAGKPAARFIQQLVQYAKVAKLGYGPCEV